MLEWPCRNVKQYPEAKQIDGLLVMRIDSPIYFANVIPVREAIAKYQRRAIRSLTPRGVPLRYIIIDMSPVTDIDASAVHWLKVCTDSNFQCPLDSMCAKCTRQARAILCCRPSSVTRALSWSLALLLFIDSECLPTCTFAGALFT